jgi:hypothetical protein
MKKIIFFGLFMIFAIGNVNAQAKGKPKSIISTGSGIKKFHEKSELETMQKGALLDLYIERINTLVNYLPYIALTTKPGVTMQDVGIPESAENSKFLDAQKENTANFLNATVAFQRQMTPYADKGNLISSILYYESMLRELNQLNEQ